MGARNPDKVTVARNRRARYDYEIGETYEAGIQLTGTEVKSLRAGQSTITEGYVQIHGNEAWLHGVYIPEYTYGNINNHAPRRTRKLLLHRREIDRLRDKLKEQGVSAVAMELYFLKGRAKLEFGVGRGKKQYDKRQSEKKKVARREMRQWK